MLFTPTVRRTSALLVSSASIASLSFFSLRRSSSASPIAFNMAIRSRSGGFAKEWPYRARDFERMDPSDDSEFYNSPRFVTHIDDRCINRLSEYYGSVLPAPSASSPPKVLDLASSWISHLPESWSPEDTHIVGIGMNKAELAANKVLTSWHVVDLNEDPEALSQQLRKEYGQATVYDAAICSVSIDYLTKPREMLADLAQVLKKDASVHLAFSNRCFPTKVVSRWLNISEEERCDMVADYLHWAGTSNQSRTKAHAGEIYKDIEIVTLLQRDGRGDPLWVIRAKRR